jgi:phosphoribosylamine---glycine ligase
MMLISRVAATAVLRGDDPPEPPAAAALAVSSSAGQVRARRWLGLGFTAAGVALLPWLVYLAVSLPASARAWHWPAAWAGLDAMEAAGLLATGFLLLRRDVRWRLAALPTAGLLLADAWFDVTTAPPGTGELVSLAMALAVELPVAALCMAVGVAGLRTRASGRPAGRLWVVRILVIGSGGREHALVRALAKDSEATALHAAPGNPGIGELAELHDVTATSPADVTALTQKLAADLVVIGPEAPLVAGVADAIRDAGFACFGPGRAAAMIEGSKSFAKQVMMAAGVPTAAARSCRTESEAVAALAEFGPPYVVKADGLAAGKGVVVTTDRAEALAHADACGTVVIEEFLDGPEVSVFALADGANAAALQPAQDYKRAGDGNEGPNTGGMGAYTPLPWAPDDLAEQTLSTVVTPTLAELDRIGRPFSGLLYVGLCLTTRGPRVVEFNARFGDPEAQVILDRLGTPLGGLLAACAGGDLAAAGRLSWLPGAAVTVVIAAEGYPANPVRGDLIEGLAEAGHVPGCYVLHAGTVSDSAGRLTASGGRVLNVVGTGDDLAAARARAYDAAALIRMRGGFYRGDIAAMPASGTSPRT